MKMLKCKKCQSQSNVKNFLHREELKCSNCGNMGFTVKIYCDICGQEINDIFHFIFGENICDGCFDIRNKFYNMLYGQGIY